MSDIPRRLGVLVPASDPVVEADLQRYLPAAVSFHAARLHQSEGSRAASFQTLNELVDAAEPAARSLALVAPELIVFACTSASLFRGYGWDLELAARIRAASGVEAITTATAMVRAHHRLGLEEVVMITPYPEETNRREIDFLETHGVRVAEHASFHCEHSRDIGLVTPAAIRAEVLAHRAAIRRCGGVFVSCTALRVFGIIEELEEALGTAVVTSNQATLWAALGHMEIDATGVPGGRLLRAEEAAPGSVRETG